MSETPRTEEAKFSGIHAHPYEEYVDTDFARTLERENTHLLVLATNAEFNRSKIERENARLQMELDASCNAEELRQVRAENGQLRNKVKNQRDRIIFLEGPTNHIGGVNWNL